MAINVQYMKKDDIVNELILNGELHENLVGLKREVLVEKLRAILAAKEALNNIEKEPALSLETVAVSEIETPQEISSTNTPEASVLVDSPLTYNDLEWTDWVLNQLDKSEKFEKYPTCDGLLRIFEVVMGEITAIDTKIVQPAQIENHNRATATCKVCYIHNGMHKSIEDAADCSTTNTDFPFNNYPSATAATMALGRCLRKAMRLKTLVREEVASPDSATMKMTQEIDAESIGATDLQKNLIQKLSKNMGIEIPKLLKYLSSEAGGNKMKPKDFAALSSIEAQVVMRQLQEYNKDGAIVPDEICCE